MLSHEFDRQVQNLVEKDYPQFAHLSVNAFKVHLEPLRQRVQDLNGRLAAATDGRLPFVIVIKDEMVAIETAMTLVDMNGTRGYVGLYPVEAQSFQPIERVKLPTGSAYLLVDIDTGAKTRNVSPVEALTLINAENRSPLTIDEGVALLTHFPHVLANRDCFYMSGSHRGDRRVAAMWVSKGRPRLGWCWAGNPHSWLGTASCQNRVGA